MASQPCEGAEPYGCLPIEGELEGIPVPWVPPAWRDKQASCHPEGEYETAVVGPAMPAARLALLLTWSLFIVMPSLGYYATPCPDSHFAQYPLWVTVPGFATIAVATYIQVSRVMPISIVPQARVTAPFKFLGCSWPFNLWLARCIVESVLGQTEFITGGLFVAKVARTSMCAVPSGETGLEEMWHKVIHKSLLGEVPFLGHSSFLTAVMLWWLLQLLQLGYALIESTPVGPVVYEQFAPNTHFSTLIPGERQNFGTALQAVAEVGEMTTVCGQHWIYKRERLKKAGGLAGGLVAYLEMVRTIIMFGVRMILEKSLNVSVQSTMMGLSLASGRQLDYQTIISLALAILMALKQFVQYTSKMMGLLDAYYQQCPAHTRTEERSAKVRRIRVVFLVFVVIFLITLGYACTKAYFAIFVCSDGLWNLTGCVDIEE